MYYINASLTNKGVIMTTINPEVIAYLLTKHKRFLTKDMSSYKGNTTPVNNMVSGLVLQMLSMGFDVTTLIPMFNLMSNEELKTLNQVLLENFRVFNGHDMRPCTLFTNFPEDVPSEAIYNLKRLVSIACASFLSDADVILDCGCKVNTSIFDLREFGACPVCQHRVGELHNSYARRFPLIDIRNPITIVMIGTNGSELLHIVHSLLYTTTGLSAEDLDIIKPLLTELGFNEDMIEMDRIVMKEVKAHVVAYFIEHELLYTKEIYRPTDILRIAASLSGRTTTLASNVKFRLSNKNRRIIRKFFNECDEDDIGEMRKPVHFTKFKALGHCLHTGKYHFQSPVCYRIFDRLRNDHKSIVTFESETERLFKSKHPDTLVDSLCAHLRKRPGVFARVINRILKTSQGDPSLFRVPEAFASVIDEVSTRVLLQLAMVLRVWNDTEYSISIPAGAVAKPHVRLNPMSGINDTVTVQVKNEMVVVIESELRSRFGRKGGLGKVFLDRDALSRYILPLSMHSASKSAQSISRGSVQNMAQYNVDDVIRLFVYWEDQTDVDLSVMMLNNAFDTVSAVAYTHLKAVNYDDEVYCVHSGDIQRGLPSGTEFIDINVNKLPADIRYILMDVVCYYGSTFDTFTSYCGYMIRSSDTGEVFEPTTVEDKWDLTIGRKSIPVCFDLKNRTVIKLDLGVVGEPCGDSVVTTGNITKLLAKEVMEYVNTKPTYEYLIEHHLAGNSYEIVDSRDDADHVFDEAFCQSTVALVDGNWMPASK